MDNRAIANRLISHAHLLQLGHENLFRIKAYRRAAETVLMLPSPVSEIIAEKGRRGLESLPGIGGHLSFTIDHLVRTGEFRTKDPGKVAG